MLPFGIAYLWRRKTRSTPYTSVNRHFVTTPNYLEERVERVKRSILAYPRMFCIADHGYGSALSERRAIIALSE